jgi:hypothetical protein
MDEKLTILQVDVATGIETLRDFTEDEVAEVTAIRNEESKRLQNAQDARTSALAKLAALGLTEEEIEAL